MTRKKVEIKLIDDESKRKTTFKKRKKGLMKKVNELSTLCGVDACAIIYSPYEPQPDIWPDNVGVQRVLGQFKGLPDMEKSKKMVNQYSFIRQRITKANDQLKKQIKENRDKEMTEVMYQCLTGKGSIVNLNLPDLNELGDLVSQTVKDITNKIESLKKGPVPPLPLPPSLRPRSKMSVGGSSSSTTYETMVRRFNAPSPPPSIPPSSHMSSVGSNNSRTINEMMETGLNRRAMEKRPMFNNNMTNQWFTDLMSNTSEQKLCLGPQPGYEMTSSFSDNPNPSEQYLGLGPPPGFEMISPFVDIPNPLWPPANSYFP